MKHIPKSGTDALPILPFAEALAGALGRQDGYDVERWLYVPNTYGEYRYILGTRGKKPLVCIGINPSTAAPDALDPTLKSVERIALAAGYDSFLMLNLYPQRATDPDLMEKNFNEALHRENMAAFAYALSLCGETPDVWAAWGAIIEKRSWLFSCVCDAVRTAKAANARWFTCGKRSAAGHPHHPLYLKNGSPLDAFDPDDYLARAAKGGGTKGT